MAHLLFLLGGMVLLPSKQDARLHLSFLAVRRALVAISKRSAAGRRATRRFSASLSVAIEEANIHTSMQNVMSPIISIIGHLLCYDSLNHPEPGGLPSAAWHGPVPQAAKMPVKKSQPLLSPLDCLSLSWVAATILRPIFGCQLARNSLSGREGNCPAHS